MVKSKNGSNAGRKSRSAPKSKRNPVAKGQRSTVRRVPKTPIRNTGVRKRASDNRGARRDGGRVSPARQATRSDLQSRKQPVHLPGVSTTPSNVGGREVSVADTPARDAREPFDPVDPDLDLDEPETGATEDIPENEHD